MLSSTLKNRAKKVGLPPGTLTYTNGTPISELDITLIDYNEDQLKEKSKASLKDCLTYLDTPSITWINICGVNNPETIASLGKLFGLHPLMLEDIMSLGQRSKIDNYKDTLYIVVRMLTYNEQKQSVEDEQVSLILGKNYVISFLESPKNVFQPILERLRQKKSRIRTRGSDYLCYALIDCLVDNYFIILEKVDSKLELLEEELFKQPTPTTLHKIQQAKREVSLLRKSVWPMREVISHFRRIETPLIQDPTKLYIQDVYDHTIQSIDIIESFRDISAGMIDIYLSNLSQRMNEIMKLLTVVSTIFVPLTFIASIYGMNFEYMPELKWRWGYDYALALMLLVFVSMVIYYKRKKLF